MLITFSSAISYFYRKGYLYLFQQWKLPQLKSVFEHIEVMINFLADIIKLILTLVMESKLNKYLTKT